ncbi:MAG TPA: aspartate--tRNA ligase [Clostridiaceae bacterium]|nr:aspartate--tRNA ligase [Clostridiaceae bacterium]
MRDFSRSHYCGRVKESDINSKATAMGWVQTSRDMGGVIFVDLRDKSGVLQVVFDMQNFTEDQFNTIEKLRSEYIIAVTGTVRERDEETYNPKIPTGTVELMAEKFEVLSEADPLPFPIDDNVEVREDLRLKYRYLDLRRPKMYQNFLLRNKTLRSIRNYLEDNEFLEVETPILTKSTPEGARDYLVPSRAHLGEFYALPQSPQVFKQLLMAAGFDKYYQIARCFRDEDLRADRQPEFTQVDLEVSFLSKNEILNTLDDLFKKVFKDVLDIDFNESFPRITYQEAMDSYGSDKPDLRFDMKIIDVTAEVKNSDFKVFTDTLKSGGVVRSINIKGGNALARTEIEELTEKAISYGAKGMAWIGIDENRNLRTILTKYFSEEDMEALLQKMAVEPGDFLIFCADTWEVVCKTLGQLRLDIGDKFGLRRKDDFKFLMVVDFPLFEYSEDEGRYVAMHHPFTMPVPEDLAKMDTDPLSIRAESYDVVLNGIELGSGSLRIYRPDIQEKMFKLLGISDEEIDLRFGHILQAFQYGAPPHGGFAFGLDRLIMLMAQEDSIREVIAFPKNREAECPLTNAPSTVDEQQLQDLNIAVMSIDGTVKGAVPAKKVDIKETVDIQRYADMSMLNLDEISGPVFEKYLADLIKFTEDLRQLDLDNYQPTINVHPIINSTRKDQVKVEFTRDELFDGTDTTEDGYILVPRIIEEN